MGHQVGLLLTPADTRTLEARLRARFDFVVFRERSRSPAPHMVDSLYIEENGKPVFDYYIARPEDLDAVVMKYIPAQNYWTAEIGESPMMEFSGSLLDDNVFHRGRVYYVDQFADTTPDWVLKSEDFRKWAKKFLAAVKKSLKPVKIFPGSICYAGEEAAALLNSGTVKVSPVG